MNRKCLNQFKLIFNFLWLHKYKCSNSGTLGSNVTFVSVNLIFILRLIFPFFIYYRFGTAEKLITLLEEDKNFASAEIYLLPPDDGMESDKDSGDEDVGGTINNLSGRQLRSEAEVEIVRIEESLPEKENEEEFTSKKKTEVRNWVKSDIMAAKIPSKRLTQPYSFISEANWGAEYLFVQRNGGGHCLFSSLMHPLKMLGNTIEEIIQIHLIIYISKEK